MAIRSVKDLVAAHNAGQTWTSSFMKNSAASGGDNRWWDWAFASGKPAFDSRIATPLTMFPVVASGNSSVFIPPIPAGEDRYLQEILLRPNYNGTSVTSTSWVVYDLVAYYAQVNGDSTDAQDMDNTLSLPRYETGEGVMMCIVNHIAPITANATATIDYTDSEGVARITTTTLNVNMGIGRITSGAPGSGAVGSYCIPLSGSSKGVRRVNRISFNTPPGGLFAIYLFRPLAEFAQWMDTTEAADGAYKSAIRYETTIGTGGVMPRIYDGAHIGMFYAQSGGSNRTLTQIFGTFTFVWN